MHDVPPLARFAKRRVHLDADNPLRALTDVINRVPGGINLGQGVCELPTPSLLRQGVVEALAEEALGRL